MAANVYIILAVIICGYKCFDTIPEKLGTPGFDGDRHAAMIGKFVYISMTVYGLILISKLYWTGSI